LSEILADTQIAKKAIAKKAIAKLAKMMVNDRESLMQLLIYFCTTHTFKRIINCPTFPAKMATLDLPYRAELLKRSVPDGSSEIPFALGYLYEVVAGKDIRKKCGQFFTPLPVAKRAVSQLSVRSGESIVDPGCGTGVFPATIFQNIKDKEIDLSGIRYLGVENSPLLALSAALSLDWFKAPKEWKILYSNFIGPNIGNEIKQIMGDRIDIIISNPPFIRFHRLGERAQLLEELNLLGYAGAHSYFLARSASLLNGERMMFVVPPEMNGTRYGSLQLKDLKERFKQTNEAIFYITKHGWVAKPVDQISLDLHAKIRKLWTFTYFEPVKQGIINKTPKTRINNISLRQIAEVHRGISTGANKFFILTDKIANELCVTEKEKKDFLEKVIPTRIPQLKSVFSEADWGYLLKEDKPCWLLTISPEKAFDSLPISIREYLSQGKASGIHNTPTSKNRDPWYYVKHSKRVPHLFFTYIARGFPRFIYNEAKVYNLTNLLGIYLNQSFDSLDNNEMATLVEDLNLSVKNWFKNEPVGVGRRYSGGIVKLEPNDLQMLPISKRLTDRLKIVKD